MLKILFTWLDTLILFQFWKFNNTYNKSDYCRYELKMLKLLFSD